MGRTHTTFLHTKGKRTFVQLLKSYTHCFFLKEHHMLGRMTDDKLHLLKLGYLAAFSWKWTKWACPFKENNWQYLLPKFEFSSKNFLENVWPPTMSLTASKLEDYSNKISSSINEYDFLVFCNKMCQYLEVVHNLVN